jgi:small-conductance mechanosensitive channel
MDWNGLWQDFLDLLQRIWDVISQPIFKLSETNISAGTILYIILGMIVLSFISSKIKQLLVRGILKKAGMEEGIRVSIGNVIRFFLLILGALIIFQSAGINLSALTVLFGALGVGIGFGLQTITDNFISGIIILFEKPIKVGDRIQLGDISGNVMSISIRATTVLTNDNISIIIPNSEFISGRVINWSHNDRNIRFQIPVGVSYNEDPVRIKKLLLEVARDNEDTLKTPEPDVFFAGFGDSSLDFKLIVWTSQFMDRPQPYKSELYFAIFEKFKEHKIEIPFPQRDLHLRSSAIPLTKN